MCYKIRLDRARNNVKNLMHLRNMISAAAIAQKMVGSGTGLTLKFLYLHIKVYEEQNYQHI